MQLSNFQTAVNPIAGFLPVALIGVAKGSNAVYKMNRINDADTALDQHAAVGLSLVKGANVEQSTAAESLKQQADELVSVVSVFKLA